MLDLLPDVAQYVLDNVVVPVAATVLTLLAGSRVSTRRAAGGEIADHDRRAAEINEDLRRWIRDRDREAGVRMSEIAQQARSQGVTSEGMMRAAAGKVYRHVLHEFRDRATLAEREFEALLAAEERPHERHRRRRGLVAPALILPDDCRARLAEWRQRAEDDPTRSELEPRLADVERPSLAA
jgi:hypothetical protein